MRPYRRIAALAIACTVLVTACLGCGAKKQDDADANAKKPDGAITMREPSYDGDAPNGKPTFTLRWSRAPGEKNYTVAVYTEAEGICDRQELSVFGAVSKTVVLLQGIDTDTVEYRVKVRPGTGRDNGAPWSEVWRISFVNGAFTVTGNAADFDPPASAATPAPEAGKQIKPAETAAPVSHDYPEPLLSFLAKQAGAAAYDLSRAASLQVTVNHCEYGEPTQVVTDAATVAAAAA